MKRFNALLATLIGVLIVLVQTQITIAHTSIEVIRTPPTVAALSEAPGKLYAEASLITAANARDFVAQGNDKYKQGNYEGAIEDYTQAIRLNSDDAEAYFKRGNAYAKLKNHQRAIEDYTQAIRIAPNSDGAYLNRGHAHFDLKDYQEAIEDYTQAIRLNPDNAEIYFNRAKAHANLKDYQKAIEDYTQVIRLNPDDAETYISRGFSHSRLKDYQEAIEDFTQAIRLNPNNTDAYYVRGLARSVLKDDQKAIEDFTQALRIKPDFAEAKRSLADLKDKQNRFQVRNFVTEGHKKYDRGDYEGAIEDYSEAVRLDPDNAYVYSFRGDAHAKLKDYQRAIEDYTQYLKIKPSDAAAKRLLGLLEAKKVINGYSATQRFQITLFISILLCFVWIVSISLHEFGHAIVAYWGGDQSVKTKGYLTLNPLKYTHPLVSIILPALFFCLGAFPLPGAAVYIERQRLRNRWWQSAVSAAGPFASFLVTLFLIALFQLSSVANAPYWLSSALAFFISLHFIFMLFNLLPFPPLDGYGIIEVWLPKWLQVRLKKFAFVGLIAICTLSFFPPFGLSIARSAFTLTQLFGVPEALPSAGFELFNRWYCALPLAAIGVFALIRKPQALWLFLGDVLPDDFALKAYERAIKVAPNAAQAWTRRGWLLLLARPPELSSTQQCDASLQSFDRAIQIDPNYYDPWTGRGWLLYLLRRYDEALVAYDRAIKLEQNDYRVWNGRGEVLVSLNRYDEALASLDKAIELRPDLDCLRNRRNLLLKSGPVDSQGVVIRDGKRSRQ